MDRLFHTVSSKTIGTVQCRDCNRSVTAPEGVPAFCPQHRDNQNPQFGWFYSSAVKSALLQVLSQEEASQLFADVQRRRASNQSVVNTATETQLLTTLRENDWVEDALFDVREHLSSYDSTSQFPFHMHEVAAAIHVIEEEEKEEPQIVVLDDKMGQDGTHTPPTPRSPAGYAAITYEYSSDEGYDSDPPTTKPLLQIEAAPAYYEDL